MTINEFRKLGFEQDFADARKFNGGQSCGQQPTSVKFINNIFGMEVKVSHHRSKMKNIETALIICQLLIEDCLTKENIQNILNIEPI